MSPAQSPPSHLPNDPSALGAPNTKQQWISSLNETLPLTGIDQNAPKIYFRAAFGFEMGKKSDLYRAIEHLAHGFRRALDCFPFLGGQVIHPKSGTDKRIRLVYSRDPANSSLMRFPDEVFDIKVHKAGGKDDYHWTYDHLQRAGVPAGAINKDILSLSPTHPTSGDSYHPVTLRVNFIPGGLILVFAFHHSITDGPSYDAFYRCMFDPSRHFDEQSFNASLRYRSNLIRLFPGSHPVDVRSFPGYDFDCPLPPQPEAPISFPTCSQIFKISAVQVIYLKNTACEYLKSRYGDSAFVSSTDTLCALVWVFVTRARLMTDDLRLHNTTRFATAVDIRDRMVPILRDKNYIGNMYLRTMTDKNVTVKDLINPKRDPQPATRRDIAEAAWLVRKAIQAFDDPAHIARHLSLLSNVLSGDDPDLLAKASDAALDTQRTGLDASVWADFGLGIDFGIPGAVRGKPDWMRKTYSAGNNGSLNILPRQGGTKGDADWEILLSLRRDVMDRILEKTELGGFILDLPAGPPRL
ncbi:hypothetical protein B0T16DRAFT_506981 [Cercophora newfieldiana]|uniref:Uncharacterized protein n=1 Tax=Cercophora newfieldiana TaxID=92897 RepID=A0AA40CTD7_9PEZI|nr:hypothetical protein B0T16DRAFT_506981 [Cercophora newfieldiana]